MLCPVLTGGSIVIAHQFIPDLVLKLIEQQKVSVFCGVPAMYNALLVSLKTKGKYNISSLRLCISGAAPMPVEILRVFTEEYGIVIQEGNGPTETSPVSYVNPPDLTKPGSVGPPLQGVQVKIVDDEDNELPVDEVGEICVRGPNVMKGYLNQPEATAEAMKGGWFHTGDLGRIDEDGYVFIVDRKKDMIIVGGINVYPREVEECLYQHPGIHEAAVIGLHDEIHGEIPAAYVVLKEGQIFSSKDIILFCRKHLANYKCPRKVNLVAELPKLSTGKIDKKQVKEAMQLGLLR